MKIKRIKKGGYVIRLSKHDTEAYGATLMRSEFRGKRILAAVDTLGLFALRVDGKEEPVREKAELVDLITWHIPREFCHLWPAWGRKARYENK